MAYDLERDVNLDACLFGGQSFTWWRQEGMLEGIARGTRVRIDPDAGTWTSEPARPREFLSTYLGADRGQPADLADDPDLGRLATAMPGLRLLDQDPWEGVQAFMISPVNNVPRIQETIARLCRALGPQVDGAHAVPGPERVARAGEARLRELGLGFRAPRVVAAAEAIAEERLSLEELAECPIDAARDQLVTLDGVGPKVAECILCYALGFDDAFPVDRWVARASERVLGEEIEPEHARQRWGEDAAMAQQLLFHGARTGLVDGLDPSPVSTFDGWRALVGVPGEGEPSTP